MKKLAVFIAFICLCVGTLFIQKDSIFDISGLSKVCFVSRAEGGDIETLQYNYTFMQPEEARKCRGKVEEIGLVCYFEGRDLQGMVSDLAITIYKVEKLQGLEIVYGYTPKSDSCIWLENKKVNVQIVVRNEDIVVGFPMILSGF